MKYITLILAFTLVLSCSNDKEVDYTVKNEEAIQKYLNENNLTSQKSVTGLHYIITEEGSGEHPTTTSNVTIAYKGYFTNGQVFDQSSAEGITHNLQQFISGWTEGITYFKEGGSGVLLVPASLGYGNYDYNTIPGGSVLIFDITLISVN
ncbi:FKBP-type peptidyl-prolyl cis-trans isomerase [Cellulophaga sp. F20128]|uniref:FKBP-type peptidyl-prolyl cis-trans isomerase n=1 Tax=Cellulophaga sp. F20128 TaxID=2926413 RepID=UPI001FF4A0E9|nr:FKBP-type peptidyl-prolyl cis-trans isomerase [Cellulophaga sp. F20128]MCK0156965.1 FKBP-type peptidyl-prolyl cis-trans isomerase [Cellulophaga sp. F20128]